MSNGTWGLGSSHSVHGDESRMLHITYGTTVDSWDEYLLLEHISPYVVLVIDDNSYGLMVALSYIYRICP